MAIISLDKPRLYGIYFLKEYGILYRYVCIVYHIQINPRIANTHVYKHFRNTI